MLMVKEMSAALVMGSVSVPVPQTVRTLILPHGKAYDLTLRRTQGPSTTHPSCAGIHVLDG